MYPMTSVMPVPYDGPGVNAARWRHRVIVAAVVLLAHALVLGPAPWHGPQPSPRMPSKDGRGQAALQWVAVLPPATPPAPALSVAPPAGSQARAALRPERAADGARRMPAAAQPPAREPAAAADSLASEHAAPSGPSAAMVPTLPMGPVRSVLPAPDAGVARDNIARSRQRGGAAFERAASDAVATPAQRLAAGIAAAAPGDALGEAQAGTSRTARVRGSAGSYCLRLKDPSLKLDPFRQELALPTNCPP